MTQKQKPAPESLPESLRELERVKEQYRLYLDLARLHELCEFMSPPELPPPSYYSPTTEFQETGIPLTDYKSRLSPMPLTVHKTQQADV